MEFPVISSGFRRFCRRFPDREPDEGEAVRNFPFARFAACKTVARLYTIRTGRAASNTAGYRERSGGDHEIGRNTADAGDFLSEAPLFYGGFSLFHRPVLPQFGGGQRIGVPPPRFLEDHLLFLRERRISAQRPPLSDPGRFGGREPSPLPDHLPHPFRGTRALQHPLPAGADR